MFGQSVASSSALRSIPRRSRDFMLRDSSCGEKSRVSGSSRVIAALVVGISLGVACASGLVGKVGAQSQYDVPSGNIRDSFVSNASPRVSLDESGVAKFSRPLEVPARSVCRRAFR